MKYTLDSALCFIVRRYNWYTYYSSEKKILLERSFSPTYKKRLLMAVRDKQNWTSCSLPLSLCVNCSPG